MGHSQLTLNKMMTFRFSEGSVIEIIVMSPNRKLLAIAERMGDKYVFKLGT